MEQAIKLKGEVPGVVAVTTEGGGSSKVLTEALGEKERALVFAPHEDKCWHVEGETAVGLLQGPLAPDWCREGGLVSVRTMIVGMTMPLAAIHPPL